MIIALIVLAVVALYALFTYNALVGLRNKVEEAFSTMDVFLKKRYDQLPNLVNIVKGYAKHESETLEKVIGMRTRANSTDEKVEAEKQISQAVHQINVVAEQYPDLKANQNFLKLQEQLNGIEEDISNARRYYNGSVREYNDKVMMAPSNIVANLFGFTRKPMFEVDNADERKNVKVEF